MKENLKKEYKVVWDYLKNLKWYLVFTVGVFLLISVLVYFGVQSEEINDAVREQLKEILQRFQGLNTFETVVAIFFNNLVASFLGIIGGVFFGVITLGFIFTNAYVIGFVVRESVNIGGIGILWGLVPHGIFELPAVFISFALGIKLGMFVFDKDPWKELKFRFNNSMKIFIYVVVPLLVVAAIIEGILIGIVS
jgi:stage II sporulation protein M